jgi:hypothetical protein
MGFNKVRPEDDDGFHLSQYTVQRRALVNTVMELRVPQRLRNFSPRQAVISFTRKNLFLLEIIMKESHNRNGCLREQYLSVLCIYRAQTQRLQKLLKPIICYEINDTFSINSNVKIY